ncbi:hypothetical protein [endosymbiont GvMRE of Glomus versiforme]|uniref:hypothetical protein n=1 Tax=endosymbiont GvMRE of Glomus versiforme TaxID=2039283 RepID=UPI000ECB8A7F|nr:hypothetical protein [endosymbiont GvMRE of Glomus versiforme]RHZ37580.1 hypothetical protein GvMRE_I1g506 [endosymbiont GvMRE of Glomus versiforme]
MTTLQDYLNNKYPTQPDKEALKEIILSEINELLEGGELDLKEFTNLEKMEVDQSVLKTPLTKINSLTSLKELILPKTQPDSDEDKKLFTDLGIEDKTTHISQQRTVKEIKRLTSEFSNTQNKKIKVIFSTNKAPQTKLDNDKDGISEDNNGEWDIYLQLERKDKKGNFAPNLVLWTFCRELTAIKHGNYDKEPLFWQHFNQELEWIKDNLGKLYKKEWELLLNPSTFSHELLETSLFTCYFPKPEDGAELTTSQSVIKPEIIANTWPKIRQEIINLTSQELNKATTDDEKEKLWIKLMLEYNENSKEWTIKVNYHKQSPIQSKIKELTTTTLLENEIELLKQQKSQLPTPEKLAQLEQEKEQLEKQLQGGTNLVEENKKLKEEIQALYRIIKEADEAERQKKLVLSELIQTPKQTKEAIKRLLKKTIQEWREYFESEDPDIAEKKFILGLSFKDPELRRKGKEILGYIIEAHENGNYRELVERWQKEGKNGGEYDVEIDFDESLQKIKDLLQVLEYQNSVKNN